MYGSRVGFISLHKKLKFSKLIKYSIKFKGIYVCSAHRPNSALEHLAHDSGTTDHV